MPEIASIPPLTKLSEEEELFRDTVRGFAERDIRPRVAAMEKAGAIDPALLAKCFELGLMGIEIPEQHGGAGGSLFMTVLAVEELSAVDASVAIFVDVQNTLVNNLLLKWASDDLRRRYLPRLAADLLGAYADRKSTRLNSSHGYISYAVFCLKKKKTHTSTLPARLSAQSRN